jgi:hypothetical protein
MSAWKQRGISPGELSSRSLRDRTSSHIGHNLVDCARHAPHGDLDVLAGASAPPRGELSEAELRVVRAEAVARTRQLGLLASSGRLR